MSDLLSRSFEIRTISDGSLLGVSGYGLEIMDGGFRQGENQILVGRGTYGSDPTYASEQLIRAWPGNKLITEFDYLRMPDPGSGTSVLNIDTVTVKLHKVRNAVFTDAQAPGLFRKRWLNRGTAAGIAAGATTKLYSSNEPSTQNIWRDDYHTDSRGCDEGFFDGFITADVAFTVWIFAATTSNPAGNGQFYPIVKATAVDRSAALPVFAGGGTFNAGYGYNFTWGSTSLTSTVNVPVPCPGGAYQIHVENNSVGAGTFRYAIGLRSTL